MRPSRKKLALAKETLCLLTDEVSQVQGAMRIVDTTNTDTFKPTTSPRCADTSVSICATNCGCKFTN